jgi:Transcriptional regulatory protein, C terminal/AAA ATPase domain
MTGDEMSEHRADPQVPEDPYAKLRGPFTPDQFYGSEELVQRLVDAIATLEPPAIELLGLPGMGKSILLHYLAHPEGALAPDSKYLKKQHGQRQFFRLRVEFRRRPLETHPFVYLWEQFYAEVKASLGARRPVPSWVAQVLEPEQAISPDDARRALACLHKGVDSLANADVRPVFLLDDFHLAFAALSKEETESLRPWRDFVAVILVVERALHKVNAESSTSFYFQMMPLERIGGLPQGRAALLLQKPAQDAEHPFPAKDVAYVLEQTGPHPYLLIRAGTTLWNTRTQLGLLKYSNKPLTDEQKAILRGHLQVHFDRTFELYWNCLEPEERTVLQELRGLLDQQEYTYTEIQSMVLAALNLLGLVKLNPSTSHYEFFSSPFSTFVATKSGLTGGPNLTGYEATLYNYLRRNAERVCTFAELSQVVWQSPPQAVEDEKDQRRRIQVMVSRLRQKLAKQTGEDIQSVREQGYQFIPAQSGQAGRKV